MLETKATTKEDEDPERQRWQSANEEEDDKGRQQSYNKEGDTAKIIIQQGVGD